jgi:hypothetical protein
MKQIVEVPIPKNLVTTWRFALHGPPPLFGEATRRDGAQATSIKRDG